MSQTQRPVVAINGARQPAQTVYSQATSISYPQGHATPGQPLSSPQLLPLEEQTSSPSHQTPPKNTNPVSLTSSEPKGPSKNGQLQPGTNKPAQNGKNNGPNQTEPADPKLGCIDRLKNFKLYDSWSWLIIPVILMLIYGLIVGIIFTDNKLKGPLAKLGVTPGFLVLNVLALANNYALVAVGDMAFEAIQWGPKLRGGEQLTTFLALSTTSGMVGWTKILFQGVCHGKKKNEPGQPQQQPQLQQQKPAYTSCHSRLWALLRIASWMLFQFPGIVLLSQVNPQLSYLPVYWTPISGGIAKFDVATSATKTWNGPTLSALVINMIRDRATTFPVDPIASECRDSSDCVSFLIPGGTKTVTPWPFGNYIDSSLSAYITSETPSYQLDFWDATERVSDWPSDTCQIFGVEYGEFELCMSAYNTQQIVAAWRYCTSNVTETGQCTDDSSWITGISGSSWGTFIAIYRRTATVTADRSTNMILDVSNLGPPESQNITTKDFSISFNGFLLPFTSSISTSLSPENQNQFWLTSSLASDLENDRAAPHVSNSIDHLRNLFMAPLLLYNQAVDGIGLSPVPSIDHIVSGLPAENYIHGSVARPVNHLTLSRWTKITYTVVMGVLIVVMTLIIAWKTKGEAQKTSSYPIVDFLALARDSSSATPHSTIEDIFKDCKPGDDPAILEAATNIKLFPKKKGGSNAKEPKGDVEAQRGATGSA